MSIIRVQKSNDFFIAPNAPFNTPTLSWEARGLLAYLLSKPDGWEVRTTDLVRQGPAGKDKVRRILQELTNTGYLHRYQERNPDGSFGAWRTLVYEVPQRSRDLDPKGSAKVSQDPLGLGSTLPSPTNQAKISQSSSGLDHPSPPPSVPPEATPPPSSNPAPAKRTLLITEEINTDLSKNKKKSITQINQETILTDFEADAGDDGGDDDEEEVTEAVSALLSVGFTEKTAVSLIAPLVDVYGAEWQTAVVSWCAEARQNKRLHTPAGFVRRKLEAGEWPPPPPPPNPHQIDTAELIRQGIIKR